MRVSGRFLAGVRGAHAFTLIEMLVVMGIAAILLALVVPAIASIMRSMGVNKAFSMLGDELNLDGQLAVSRNRDVQIHFYQLGSISNSTDLQYRAFRSFTTVGNSTVLTPTGNVKYLPEPVIISTGKDSSGSKVSTLLDTTVPGPTSGSEMIPGATTSAPFVSFTFRANGGTNLSVTNNWYLTLYTENAHVNPTTGVPDNYFTVQIDPVTARVRTYRP